MDTTLVDQSVVERRGGTAPVAPPIVPIIHIDSLHSTAARNLTLEEFEVAVPSAEALKPYPKIKRYWEPLDPGMELKYVPKYPALSSSRDGQWRVQNLYEDELVRRRLYNFTGGNPDLFLVDEKLVPSDADTDLWMQCMNCPFRTVSVVAAKAHTRHWKHTIS